MRRLVCVGCGASEDLNNPTGDIRTVQFSDLTPLYTETGQPEKAVTEDLCASCRARVRRDFFGEVDETLLEMPLMKVV